MITRLIAVVAVVGGSLLVAAARNATGSDAAKARVGVILTELEALECSHECEYCGGGGTEHEMTTLPGNDGGEFHTCAISFNGCRDHRCDAYARDLPELESLLGSLDRASVDDLAGIHPSMFVNRERRALQVLGCGEKVILSIPLSTTQAGQP